MKKRFNFPQACTEMLLYLEATSDTNYHFQLQTVAGTLRLSPFDDWLTCRFDDVHASRALVGHGRLNPYSGKWNWHFVNPDATDVDNLQTRLRRLLPEVSN